MVHNTLWPLIYGQYEIVHDTNDQRNDVKDHNFISVHVMRVMF